jgi:hypothetical protein
MSMMTSLERYLGRARSGAPAPQAPPRGLPSSVTESLLLSITVLAATPFFASLVTDPARRQPLVLLAPWANIHLFRMVTGYTALGVIVFQVLIAARLRTRLPGSLSGWKSLHKRCALPLLLIVLVHTGGRWGTQLNGWLLASLVGMILVAQTGHIAKALVAEKAEAIRALGRAANANEVKRTTWMNDQANGENGVVHRTGLLLHVAFAATVTTLLGFHVFGVYFFH